MIFKNFGFTAQTKIKTATLVFSVLVLILLTNLQERNTINRVNQTVTSIYEDRIVVGNYILTLSYHLDDIIQLLKTSPSLQKEKVYELISKINEINLLYNKTILTEKENTNFIKFKELMNNMKLNIDNDYIDDALSSSIQARNILKNLSEIQVTEGKNKLDEVLSMTSTRSFLSYLEIVIIIIIAILIQKLILSTKPLTIDKKMNNIDRLN